MDREKFAELCDVIQRALEIEKEATHSNARVALVRAAQAAKAMSAAVRNGGSGIPREIPDDLANEIIEIAQNLGAYADAGEGE